MSRTIAGLASYVENRDRYIHVWDKGNLYSSVDTTLIRNVLTTTFVLLNLGIVVVGGFFLKVRNLHKLKREGEAVPIKRLTSWISLTGTITYGWQTRQCPGGFYGFVMFLTGAFGLTNQYFINSFVVPATIITPNCNFSTGIVTTSLPQGEALVPSSSWPPAITVYNGLYNAYFKNNGPLGIYDKVPLNSAFFTPSNEDVLGQWNCSYLPDTTMALSDWQSDSSLLSFLDQQNFLFTEANVVSGSVSGASSSYSGFLAWSADQTENTLAPWFNVKASISTGLDSSLETAIVTNLQCHLYMQPGNWNPPVMPSKSSLSEWGGTVYGFLTLWDPEHYGFGIEWMLDEMVMVAGSKNNDQLSSPDGLNSYNYRCSLLSTEIMPAIWVILSAILLIFLYLLDAAIVLFLLEYFSEKNRDHGLELVKSAPASVQEWQVTLLKEVMNDDKITAKDLRLYSYGWDNAKSKYGVKKTPEEGSPAAINPSTISSSTYDPAPQHAETSAGID